VLRLPGLGAAADGEGGRFIIHPLAPGSERHYRFRYAGETQVRLADGRVVRLLELQSIPRRSDPRLVRGSLWLESETYGIVRTVFRLARPLEVALDLELPRAATRTLGLGGGARGDLRVLAMEAALWEGRWWLPRWITMEGVGEIGSLTFPHSLGAPLRRLSGWRARRRRSRPTPAPSSGRRADAAAARPARSGRRARCATAVRSGAWWPA
jgi:hypothetical protein